jgi:iron only hydrogenase large subunit-like protein
MDGYDIRVALPAPSFYGQFGMDSPPRLVFEALRAIGFDEVFDVAWGAKALTGAIVEFGRGEAARPLISSACPVVVRLIQLRFPSLIENLVPFLPPVEVAAREVRSRLAAIGRSAAGRRVGVFFISPCTSKVTAIKAPLGYADSQVDAVFSFQDIYAPVRKALKAASSPAQPREPALPRIGGLGSGFGWARSDGELEALEIPGAVSVDGIENVIALLEAIDNGKLADIPYIEALACPGGCVGGPMAVENPHVARTTMKAITRAEYGAIEYDAAEAAMPLRWEEEVLPRPAMVLDRDMARALAMEERLEEIAAALPGLDCGACGAPDCRALAEDVVKGCAKIDDCIVRIKEMSARAPSALGETPKI